MALGSTQAQTEISTTNVTGSKLRLAHKADNSTTICVPIVWKMWEPQCLTTLWASTAFYTDIFTFFYVNAESVEKASSGP
jgi:hypothetical protein